MKKLLSSIFILALGTLASQVNLTANLKACLPFNGNANDISGSANNGTVNGATLTSDRFGNPNSAYSFNTNKNITISSLGALASTNELTISMWAKATNNTSNCLFSLAPDQYTDRCVGCAAYANGGSTMMLFDYGDLFSGGRTSATGIPLDLSNWHHYVYVTSQSGNIKQMYRDGSIVSNAAYGLSCTNKSVPFQIGAGFDQGAGSLWFNGYIDDVCIYNRALTAAEVSALYAGTGACFNVGIEELKNIESFVIYPTVSQLGIYTIQSNKLNSESVIEIYSVEGKLIKSYTDISGGNFQINISDTEAGIYFVKLNDKEGSHTQKIVKN